MVLNSSNKTIRIKYVDFWAGFIPTNNYFYNLLSEKYTVDIVDDPDYLFYSCYGKEYLQYKCIRIFYTAENIRPDFTGCDYAISFDYINKKNHLRLPLYVWYIDHYKKLHDLLTQKPIEELRAKWLMKTKFCCFVVSNGKSKKRVDFFKKLNSVFKVDSGGKFLNNIGDNVSDKLAFIKDYKFVIAFENSSYPGYTTEKVIEPIFENCIPIYWGNNRINEEINTSRIIDYNNFKNEDDLIDFILKVNDDAELALSILNNSVFTSSSINTFLDKKFVLNFFNTIFEKDNLKVSVATTYAKYIHFIKRKLSTLISLSKGYFKKSFR